MTALEVKNLSFTYAGGRTVLKDVCFSVQTGETIVFAGVSGCGKTTLCRILSGIIPASIPGELSGTILLNGSELAGMSLPVRSREICLLFQDPDDQIVCTTVEDELAFALENLCVPPEQIRAEVDRLLEHYRLTELRYRSPAMLSGGQKKLVALASMMALGAKTVILDEPMSNLDENGVALVREVIASMRADGKTIIIVEHDLRLVTDAERWLIFEDGGVKLDGRPEEILGDIENLRSMGLWM